MSSQWEIPWERTSARCDTTSISQESLPSSSSQMDPKVAYTQSLTADPCNSVAQQVIDRQCRQSPLTPCQASWCAETDTVHRAIVHVVGTSNNVDDGGSKLFSFFRELAEEAMKEPTFPPLEKMLSSSALKLSVPISSSSDQKPIKKIQKTTTQTTTQTTAPRTTVPRTTTTCPHCGHAFSMRKTRDMHIKVCMASSRGQ